MTETQRLDEWVKWYEVSGLKMNALLAVLENDGEKMLTRVMGRLGLESASSVVKACRNDWKR